MGGRGELRRFRGFHLLGRVEVSSIRPAPGRDMYLKLGGNCPPEVKEQVAAHLARLEVCADHL